MINSDIKMVESFKNLAKNISTFFDENLLKNADMSCSELSVLRAIYEEENEDKKMNITKLASSLEMTKSAASQLVSKLERKGFVKRKINLFDKKINYITLTNQARNKYESKIEEYKQVINKVSLEMGEEDSKELSRLLEKLSNIINSLGKDEVNA